MSTFRSRRHSCSGGECGLPSKVGPEWESMRPGMVMQRSKRSNLSATGFSTTPSTTKGCTCCLSSRWSRNTAVLAHTVSGGIGYEKKGHGRLNGPRAGRTSCIMHSSRQSLARTPSMLDIWERVFIVSEYLPTDTLPRFLHTTTVPHPPNEVRLHYPPPWQISRRSQ